MQVDRRGGRRARAFAPGCGHAIVLAGFAWAVWISAGPIAAETVARSAHSRIELIANRDAIVPGERLDVAIVLTPDPGWHSYWINPGDSGQPLSVEWELPAGAGAGQLQFPSPEEHPEGPLMAYVYTGPTYFLTQLQWPESLPGEDAGLAAHVEWLECDEICLPAEARLELRLPIRESSLENHAVRFAGARRQMPRPQPGGESTLLIEESRLKLQVPLPPGLVVNTDEVYFFAARQGLIAHAEVQRVTRTEDRLVLDLPRDPVSTTDPESVAGIVRLARTGPDAPPEAWWIEARPIANALFPRLLGMLGLAFLGGLLLNLMPCVLPVLSLKLLAFAREDRGQGAGESIFFALGVIGAFWIVAGVLFALRAGGEAIGWGFQLQSPVFVFLLALFLFLFALNLLGVFEIAQPGGVRVGISAQRSAFGSIGLGMLTVLLATPCTAPFRGAALGFGLTQSPLTGFAIFTGLGLGLATPFLILPHVKGLRKVLPPPGVWMQLLQNVLGFVLLATVLWLFWILGRLAGTQTLFYFGAAALAVSVAAWSYGRSQKTTALRARRFGLGIAFVFLSLGIGLAFVETGSDAAEAPAHSEQSWSPERLSQLRTSRLPVFVDFTADWCLSCQVNEAVALNQPAVRERFAQLNITFLKADWTRRDARITQALAELGRSGVPVYALYVPGRAPVLLPEVLTEAIVLNALDTAFAER